VILLGLILMLGGLVAIARSIRGGLPEALARLGSIAAVAGATVGLLLLSIDGVAAKHLAQAWATAPSGEHAAALHALLAEEAINFALGTLFYILFAGVTFVLLGLAVAWSRVYPRWLGWTVVIAGAGSVVVGLVQGQVGETNAVTRIPSIIFPTVITLWLAWMGVLLLRKARAGAHPPSADRGRPGRADSTGRRPSPRALTGRSPRAPVRVRQMMPLSTWRWSRQRPPRRPGSGRSGRSRSHSALVRSPRPIRDTITPSRDPRNTLGAL
jgi:hypothetical protein